jgi:tetratricopeptide (TPR) repeat protein
MGQQVRRHFVEQDRVEDTLERLAAALPAGKARLEQWLACAAMLESAGEAVAARAIHEGIGLARSRLSYMPPQMRAALAGQSADPLDLIEILVGIGLPQAAVDLLRGLKRVCNQSADLHFQLGSAYAVLGDGKQAIASFEAALERDPAHADAHLRLGYLLSERGAIGEGFEHFMTRARIVSDEGRDKAGVPLHKVRHDQEQRAHLASLGVPTAEAFHLGDGARIAGPMINPAHTEEAILARWRDASPQLVVLDEFLTRPALERLRNYCLESTIWHRIYEAGYIGAIPADGFACPLLAQLAEEIAERWPRIVGPHRFKYLGAFKYDSELSRGTNTHADLAAVNVNFYITPDEANLDPESGGMAVWNSTIDTEPLMRQLNSSEAGMQAYLSARKAVQTRIPHRSNRVVIFKSSLVHKTDDCSFRTGYANKRINVSLLFGEYGASTRV